MTQGDDFRLLSKKEIVERLQKLKLEVGKRPGEGDVLSVYQISRHLHFSNYTTSQASHGIMSDKTQIILSRFFHMWESGRIKFTYQKSGGWKVEYPDNPIPRGEVRVGMHVTLGESGPRLSYRREE